MADLSEETTRKPVRIWPIYKEDYGHHYGAIRYAGKKVLDIGADIGSTADFFLRRGAREVVAVEGDKGMYEQLVKNAKNLPGLKPVFLFIQGPEDYENLIKTHRPDVLKADCEGCEKHLFNVSDEVYCMVPEYMVETHSAGLLKAMMEKCERNNYVIVKVVPWHTGVDIIYAKR